MTRERALEHVASMLASETASHVEALRDLPQLAENTGDVIRKNREIAIALKIDNLYSEKLQIHMQGLWDLLPIKRL